MSLEEILTNRNRLSEEILQEVKEAAIGFGVAILRADVKDLIFPGIFLQEIMNRVLAAERMSQVQLVEARTKAETQRRLDAESKTQLERLAGNRVRRNHRHRGRGGGAAAARSGGFCLCANIRRYCGWRNWSRCAVETGDRGIPTSVSKSMRCGWRRINL